MQCAGRWLKSNQEKTYREKITAQKKQVDRSKDDGNWTNAQFLGDDEDIKGVGGVESEDKTWMLDER